MSKRRKPGEIVRRTPGSGFVGSADPEFVRVPDEPIEEWHPCMMSCGDDLCREYANVPVVGGRFDSHDLCHISECQMKDVAPSLIAKRIVNAIVLAERMPQSEFDDKQTREDRQRIIDAGKTYADVVAWVTALVAQQNAELTAALHQAKRHPDYTYNAAPAGATFGPECKTMADCGYERNPEGDDQTGDESWRRKIS